MRTRSTQWLRASGVREKDHGLWVRMGSVPGCPFTASFAPFAPLRGMLFPLSCAQERGAGVRGVAPLQTKKLLHAQELSVPSVLSVVKKSCFPRCLFAQCLPASGMPYPVITFWYNSPRHKSPLGKVLNLNLLDGIKVPAIKTTNK